MALVNKKTLFVILAMAWREIGSLNLLGCASPEAISRVRTTNLLLNFLVKKTPSAVTNFGWFKDDDDDNDDDDDIYINSTPPLHPRKRRTEIKNGNDFHGLVVCQQVSQNISAKKK